MSHRLAGHDAAGPRQGGGIELAELLRYRARRLVAKLMTRVAAVGLDDVEPLGLALQGDRDPVALGSRARELALVRHLEHRIPVDGRVVFRRRGGGRRHRRDEVEVSPGDGLHLGRIDEPVAAHPHTVRRLREVGEEVAPAIVGDDDLGELGRELGGLRDHPDAGFRSVRAGDHATEIAGAEPDRRDGRLLRPEPDRPGGQNHGDGDRHQANERACHGRPLWCT